METTSAERTAHLDVLIVGAGLSGIGAGHYLQTECPWAELRHLRGTRRHRRDLGPLPLSRHPLRLGHAHAGLLVPSLGRREVDRRRRLHTAVHQGHRQGVRRRLPTSASTTGSLRPTGRRPIRSGTSRPSGRTPTRPSSSRPASSSPAAATTATTTATCPTSQGMADFAGTIVHPQAWPEDSTSPERGSWSSAAERPPSRWSRRWPTPPPTSPCCSARPPTSPRCPRRAPSSALLRKVLPRATGRDSGEVVPRPPHAGLLRGEPEVPEAGPADAVQGSGTAAAARLRHRHPLHAPLRPVGPALLRRAERRPLQGDLQPGPHRWSPTRSSASPKAGSSSRRATNSRRTSS